jgi:hypothetical protein
MRTFKQFLEDHDPNGELQAGMAASGANTVADDGTAEQKFMGSEKKTTLKIKAKPIWKAAKGHQAHRGGAGTHADKRLSRLKTRGNQNRKAIDDSSN